MERKTFQYIITGVFIAFFIIGFLSIALFGYLEKKGEGKKIIDAVPVVVWGTVDERYMGTLLSIIKEQLLSRGVSDIEYIEKNKNTFLDEYIKSFAFSNAPDIIFVDHNTLLTVKDTLLRFSFTKTFKRSFYEQYFIPEANIFIIDEGYIGIPFLNDSLVLFYNENIKINKRISSIPEFWPQLKKDEIQTTVRKTGVQIENASIPLGSYNNYDYAVDIISLFIIQSTKGEKQITQKNIETILKFYKSFATPSSSVFTWNSSLPNARDLFLSNKLFIYPAYISEYDILRRSNPNLVIRVAEIPQLTSEGRQATVSTLYAFGAVTANSGCVRATKDQQLICNAYRKAQKAVILGSLGIFKDKKNKYRYQCKNNEDKEEGKENNLGKILPFPPALNCYHAPASSSLADTIFADSLQISKVLNISTEDRKTIKEILREYIIGSISVEIAADNILNVWNK